MNTVTRNEIFVEDSLAFGDNSHRILAEVTEIEQQRQNAAQGLSVLNVDIGTRVHAKFLRKFHLGQVQFITRKEEADAEKGTKFADTGIVLCSPHEKQTSPSLELSKF